MTLLKESVRVQCNTCGKWWLAIPPVQCCGVLILDEMLDRKESKMERLKWYLKQLFPLHYMTTFTQVYEGGVDQRKLCSWRMWLGRSFFIQYFNLAETGTETGNRLGWIRKR